MQLQTEVATPWRMKTRVIYILRLLIYISPNQQAIHVSGTLQGGGNTEHLNKTYGS